MLCSAAILNYLDRSMLGWLAPAIQQELAISGDQYVAFYLTDSAYLWAPSIIGRLAVRPATVQLDPRTI